jgi:hypothetical protein
LREGYDATNEDLLEDKFNLGVYLENGRGLDNLDFDIRVIELVLYESTNLFEGDGKLGVEIVVKFVGGNHLTQSERTAYHVGLVETVEEEGDLVRPAILVAVDGDTEVIHLLLNGALVDEHATECVDEGFRDFLNGAIEFLLASCGDIGGVLVKVLVGGVGEELVEVVEGGSLG